MKPLELYLHIPFCISKCKYCDFLSAPSEFQERQDYVESLCRDIRSYRNLAEAYVVVSIFLGGGTPSVLTPAQIKDIFKSIKETFQLSGEAEITIEMNPGTVDKEKLRTYREVGINRLSIGLQSALDEELKKLGRIHTFEEFLDTYKLAREAGFHNINIDLMSAIPGQTVESYEHTLRTVAEIKPEHISAYSLIIEEGTPFYESEEIHKKIPNEEADREMYQFTKEILAENGYDRYEISNYALKGKECIHNLGYWSGIPYIGFGLGASSYFEGTRFSNERNLEHYKKEPYVPFMMREDYTVLSQKDKIEEFMFLGLRKRAGISKKEFRECFHKNIMDVYGEVISKYEKIDLLEWIKNGEMLRLTDAGIDVSDYIFCDFML